MNRVNLCGLVVLSQQFLCSCDSDKGFVDNVWGIPVNIILLGMSFLCVIICVLSLRWSWMILKNVDYEEVPQKIDSSIKTKDRNSLVNEYRIQRDEIAALKRTIRELEKVVNDIKYDKAKYPNVQSMPQSQNAGENKSTDYSSAINVPRKERDILPNECKEVKDYFYLKVIDGGKLVISQSPETAHYRAWTINGTTHFEFYSFKIGRAINNRTSIIVPFCDVIQGTIDPDSAQNLIVKKEGILSNDFSVLAKVLIQYS